MTSRNQKRVLDLATVTAGCVLGLGYIHMGLAKALDPVAFLKIAYHYDLITEPVLLNCVAGMLPWFEVFCGTLLLTGVAMRGAAVMSIVMLLPFTALVFQRALSLAGAQGLPLCAVSFDCGCGGGEVLICHKLAQNISLLLLSGWLAQRRHRTSWSQLFKSFSTNS